ncbi:peptidase inhibitor family I36 protein [Streptomyces sp. NPDC088387]|uniref:peptidase inhibitor family I36 protein n=1 Tax=Streptomyces sp. NPDC088387 TaxID=3365859 RepID=UPI0037FF8096
MTIKTARKGAGVGIAALALLGTTWGGVAVADSGGANASVPTQQAGNALSVQAQVDRQLRIAPGGEQTGRNEVSYNDGSFVVTFAPPGAEPLGLSDCPSGWFCFWDGGSYTGSMGQLSSCGWQDLDDFGWSDRVSSVYNRTSDDVRYYNHHDSGDELLFTNQAGKNGNLTTGTSNNKADHVNRLC